MTDAELLAALDARQAMIVHALRSSSSDALQNA
jgi:hypothetical protein